MKIAVKTGLVVAMVLLVCSCSAGVAAQERRPHESRQLQEVLELTEAQVTAIRGEQRSVGERIHGLREQIRALDERVYQVAEDTGDPTAVGKLVLQKIAVQRQIEGEEEGLQDRINSVLTPAQQDKLKQLKEADQLSRGWDALLTGEEMRVRHEAVPRGGGSRPHRQRMPEK